MDNNLRFIKVKERKINFLKSIDLLLRVVLTLVGAVSLVDMLMFLNNMFGVSYFVCLIISLIVPSVYSYIVNASLQGFDNKIRNMELDLIKIKDEYDNDNKMTKDVVIKDIEIRFDGLSNERKMELLMYVKEKLSSNLYSGYLRKIENEDSLSLMDLYMEKDNDSLFWDDSITDKEKRENYTKSKKKREFQQYFNQVIDKVRTILYN